MRRRSRFRCGVKLVLDTNAVLWWFADTPTLPGHGEALDDPANPILVSAASAWETCTKVRIGKLPSGHALCEDFSGYLQRYHFEQLAITVEHGQVAGRMSDTHKDPFDRMLAAQGLIEDVPIVTNDAAFTALA